MVQPMLSIIIVNWNGDKFLHNCLQSLFTKSSWGSYACEIIVIDNNSADDSVQMVTQVFPCVRLVKNNENFGFATASNQGIKITEGEYILLLNNDTLIQQPNCFANMLSFLEDNPDVGILGCRLVYPDGTIQSDGERFNTTWEIFKSQVLFSKTWRRILARKNIQAQKFHEADYISGACLMTRREVFRDCGLLKEDYFMYGEDMEFCYRVQSSGWKVGVLNDVEIIHFHSKSTEKNISEMVYHSMKNTVENVRLLYGHKQAKLTAIFCLIGLFFRFILAAFRKNKSSRDYLICIWKFVFQHRDKLEEKSKLGHSVHIIARKR